MLVLSDIDSGFNKLFQIINNTSVAYKFVLYALLKSSSVYSIEGVSFPRSYIYVFLESYSILGS